MTTDRYDWSRLTHLQIGKYAEYLMKMEFTLWGFDVYSSEVDDKGIDFVVRFRGQEFFEVQVKSVRVLNYIFFPKSFFKPQPNLLAAVVIFTQYEVPALYLIPSQSWQQPNVLLKDRDFGGNLKSKPEYGINLSVKNMPLLEPYRFEKTVATILLSSKTAS